MGMFKDFLKAAKTTAPLAIDMLRVQYHRGTMTPPERDAYDAISLTVRQDNATNEIRCSVPAGIPDSAARKALHVLQLEYGNDWKVVTDKPAQPGAPKP